MEMEESVASTASEGEILGIQFGLASHYEIRKSTIRACPINHARELTNPFLDLPSEKGRCESCGTAEPGKCEGCSARKKVPMTDLGGKLFTEDFDAVKLVAARPREWRKKTKAEATQKAAVIDAKTGKNSYLNISEGSSPAPKSLAASLAGKLTTASRSSKRLVSAHEEGPIEEIPLFRRPRQTPIPTLGDMSHFDEPPHVGCAKELYETVRESSGRSTTPRQFPRVYKVNNYMNLPQHAREKNVMATLSSWVPENDVNEMLKDKRSIFPSCTDAWLQTGMKMYSLNMALTEAEKNLAAVEEKMLEQKVNLEKTYKAYELKKEEASSLDAKLKHEVSASQEQGRRYQEEVVKYRNDVEAMTAQMVQLKEGVQLLQSRSLDSVWKMLDRCADSARAAHRYIYPESIKEDEFVEVYNNLIDGTWGLSSTGEVEIP